MHVYIIGCGGNAKVVVDICVSNDYNIAGFFDDNYRIGDVVYHQYKVIGTIDAIASYGKINIINSIGDCKTRFKITAKLSNCNLNWINCIHPRSYIAPTATIGYGNIICYGAFINSDTILGNFNLVNTYSIIEHDCCTGNYNHFAPKTTLCGNITVGNTNMVGVGSSIIPGKKIGNLNTIGAGSVVITNVTDDNTIVGIPGKVIKKT